MKLKLSLIIAFLFLIPLSMKAQLEKVIVETYYISDANDATDTTGGYLEEGSTTYRIYIDLAKGSTITKLYGDANHILRFTGSDIIFNNKADGQTFAKEFSKGRLQENTVALDSWLTLGQTTKNSQKTFGILKTSDSNGSFIGGSNNDGGSAAIAGGLLVNNNSLAGIPLITNDGLDTSSLTLSSWGDYGIIDVATQTDSTIFGSLITGNEFISYNAGLQNSGTSGVNADSNEVLIAQITTKGEISFQLNIEVVDSTGTIIHYVSTDSILVAANNEVYSRWLTYPYEQICGCPDPHYLEYIADRDCDNVDSCQTIIVFGCMDTLACNYDPAANYNMSSLCCYPGYCNDRDLEVVCPDADSGQRFGLVNLYPNPAEDNLTIHATAVEESEVLYSVVNSFGTDMVSGRLYINNRNSLQNIDISLLEPGLYLLKITSGDAVSGKLFMKN
jgi:hypothetical protein